MVIERIQKLLSERIMIGDGAIGTLLQQRGLKPGRPPESMLIDAPGEVEAVHRLYVDAGADMVTTNSFGGSRPKLAQHGLADQVKEINHRAVEVARSAAGDRAFVAASIGPTGELLLPMGSMTMDEMLEVFREQVIALRDAGADFAIIETMGDIGELQAAARACFLENLPFIASMTYDEHGRSLAGSTAAVTSVTLEPYGPLAIGTNCGMGPDGMVDRVREYAAVTAFPILAQPNAGLPEYVDGKTVFKLGPEEYARKASALADAGAAVVGGCCGTTPEHISLLKRVLADAKPTERRGIESVRFAARAGIAEAGTGLPFCVIGERINPTGRKLLSKQLKNGDFTRMRQDARTQLLRGANILDVNMGVPDVDEPDLMIRAVQDLQGLVPEVPLSIDSNDPETLIRGLKQVIGRPLLNSINGESERMERLLPVVRETGANFIALAMDETGIPADAEARMKIIRRIIRRAEALGIHRNRILVDCLVFTVGSQPHQPRETLAAVQRVQDTLGCATILGVSNVSFGLPRRAVLSSAFLAMALQAGLTAGIVNPLSDRMMETLRASELLLNRDSGARNYVTLMEQIDARPAPVKSASQSPSSKAGAPNTAKTTSARDGAAATGLTALQEAVIAGDKTGVIPVIDALLNDGTPPAKILAAELVPAIQEVGRRYGAGKIYLPQLILAGETMRAGVDYLRPKLLLSNDNTLHNTPFVLGTVSGDIHDIGKNIVGIVLENQGFHVIDLGKNVPPEMFVDAVRKHRAPVAGLSALMTTTMPSMEETVQTLHSACPGVRVMVGGAVVTRAFSERIQADGYAREAVEAGALAMRLAGIT